MQRVTTKAHKDLFKPLCFKQNLTQKFHRNSFLFPLVLGFALISNHAGRGTDNKTIERLAQQPLPLPLIFDTYYCIRVSFGTGFGTLHS